MARKLILSYVIILSFILVLSGCKTKQISTINTNNKSYQKTDMPTTTSSITPRSETTDINKFANTTTVCTETSSPAPEQTTSPVQNYGNVVREAILKARNYDTYKCKYKDDFSCGNRSMFYFGLYIDKTNNSYFATSGLPYPDESNLAKHYFKDNNVYTSYDGNTYKCTRNITINDYLKHIKFYFDSLLGDLNDENNIIFTSSFVNKVGTQNITINGEDIKTHVYEINFSKNIIDKYLVETAYPHAMNTFSDLGFKIPDSAINNTVIKTFKCVLYISDDGNLIKRDDSYIYSFNNRDPFLSFSDDYRIYTIYATSNIEYYDIGKPIKIDYPVFDETNTEYK